MLNYRYGETECILKNKTKLDPNHSVGIIHSSLWILGPAHSMNAVWNTCTVQYSTVVFRVFTSKWKQHACSTILKCVAARVWYYFRDSPAPCSLITNIGRSLMLAGRLFRKPWMSWGRLSACILSSIDRHRRFQDPCRSQQNIVDTAFCLACIWSN